MDLKPLPFKNKKPQINYTGSRLLLLPHLNIRQEVENEYKTDDDLFSSLSFDTGPCLHCPG